MRLRFQSKRYIYEVISEIHFKSIGDVVQKTYYGSEYPLSKSEVIKRATNNIKKKFLESSGKINKIFISNIYF
jgi:hypothetical protein